MPWTDLTYALVPNGSTLDYVADAPYTGRLGVMKQSYVNALYLVGCETPTTLCTTTDPRWNLGATRDQLNRGEPYTDPALEHHARGDPDLPLVVRHRRLQAARAAADPERLDRRPVPRRRGPALLQPHEDGLPAHAGLAVLRRHRPHARAEQARGPAALRSAVTKWLRYYVKGKGRKPFQGVQALTETCPSTAASAGPFKARTWAALAPGEVRLSGAPAQTIQPDAGDPAIGATFDAVTGSACATVAAARSPASPPTCWT